MEVTKVKCTTILSNSFILKPNYHLNFGKKRIENAKRNNCNFKTLNDVTESVFTGGIFKRIFVPDLKYGLPYISAQHMMTTDPLDVAKIISIKYTPRQEDMCLKENQILISCAGTIGNVKLITKDLQGVIGSQDIIRVTANSTIPYGYLYAYLASRTAYSFMQSYIYGSVVPRIEPNTLSKLPIPLLTAEKQETIHNLIVDASNKRMEGNQLLNEAQEFFLTKNLEENVKIGLVNINKISTDLRFGGNYYLSKGHNYENTILNSDFFYVDEVVNDIFTSGRDKRNYTSKENGLPFLSNGDISSTNPFNHCNFIVSKFVNKHSLITDDMILAGRVGQDTVGKVYLPYKLIIGTVASDNIIRIKIKDKKIKNYVFAFLSSKIGKEIIRKRKTGVGQPFITENMLYKIPIPKLDDLTIEIISKKIEKFTVLHNDSLQKELEAIDLIEKEIDQWQQ